MALYKSVFSKPTAEDYLEEAIAAANFIDSRRVETPNGIYWSLEDTTATNPVYYDEICMYAGSAGISHYFLQLYKVTKNEKYLNDAELAAKYIIWRWNNRRELAKNFSKWAFTTGYSGVSSFLLELYEITLKGEYKATVLEIADETIKDAKKAEDGDGYWWSTYPGIVGDGGTILYLLHLGKVLNRKDYREFAVEAGKIYLKRVRDYEGGGRYYLGVDPKYFKSDDNYIDPNFPMGTAGIGFLFLKLYEETGDKTFLDAVEGIPEFLDKIALKDGDDAALLPHGLPTRPDTYYLGYCHGPVGTSRFFYELYQVTKKEEYRKFEHDLARGIIRTGAPEYHTPGYWHIHCYCCGTAGFLHLFLSIWAATGSQEFLGYANRVGKSLLGWSFHSEGKNGTEACWHQAFAYVNQKDTTTKIGMYDGAAGIGWSLLELYTALKGEKNFFAARSIDDPYPVKFTGKN